MNKFKREIVFFIVFFLPVFLCGCWNKVDLSEKAIISGIGIDRNTDKINLTLQTILLEEVMSGEAGGNQQSEQNSKGIIISHGTTVFDAIRNFSLSSGRKGLWSHCEVIVIGSDCAKKGINEVLDFLTRDHEVRFRTWVLISKSSGKDILSSKLPFEKNTSFGISDLLESSESTSYSYSVDLLHLLEQLIDLDGTALLPAIKIDVENDCLALDGSAIIKDYKLIDWLNKTQTRGYLWISGDIKSGIVNVEMDDSKHGIEIMKYNKKINVSFNNEIPTIDITLNVKASLGEIDDLKVHLTKDYITSLENETAKVIKKEVESVINKAQNLNTDFLGFSSIIYKKEPKKWKNIEGDWENIFPGIQINTEVKVNIFKTGLKS